MILIRAHVYARENVIRLLILIPFFIREPNETNRRCAWIAVDARNFAEFVIRGSEKQNAPSVCVFLTSRTGISISRPCVWVFLATSYDARPARASVSTRGVRASAPARALSSHPTRRRCPSSRPKSQWPAPDPARPLVVPGIRVSTSSRAYLPDAIGAASAAPRLPRASASARPPKAPPAAFLARSPR